MDESEPREALASLVRDFRLALEGLAMRGVVDVSAARATSLAGADDEGAYDARLSMEREQPRSTTSAPSAAVLRLQDSQDLQGSVQGQTPSTLVCGEGPESAGLMFVAVASGATAVSGEDQERLGAPFVGEAGRLLDKMLLAMGWSRTSVSIAYILKSRSAQDRVLEAGDVEAYEQALARQIAGVKPKVIVSLGKPATHLLLQRRDGQENLRGTWQNYSGIPLMPTYHPEFLVREPSKKRGAWEDLQKVMSHCKAHGIGP